MNVLKKYVFLFVSILHVNVAIISLLWKGDEGLFVGSLACIIFLNEIRNALIPMKLNFGGVSNPSKQWHTRRGTLKRYRMECICLYSLFVIAIIVGLFLF